MPGAGIFGGNRCGFHGFGYYAVAKVSGWGMQGKPILILNQVSKIDFKLSKPLLN
jgi:hypothetical protein